MCIPANRSSKLDGCSQLLVHFVLIPNMHRYHGRLCPRPQLFRIFELALTYTLRLGRVKINFPSALVFPIFELALTYTLRLGRVKINFPTALDFSVYLHLNNSLSHICKISSP